MQKKKAIIYGIGMFYGEMEEQINEMYEVVAKTDRNADMSGGVLALKEAFDVSYDVVIIMIRDIKICFDVINTLRTEYGISCCQMFLGLNLEPDNAWDSLDIHDDGHIIFKVNNISIITKNVDEFNNIKDIFSANCYGYFLNDTSEEIVIDIGMNIGGASLYFYNRENVKKVYGFEPFPDTFAEAEENFKLNGIAGTERMEVFPYGVSDVNTHRQVIYNKNMTCGQSTNDEANAKARKNYQEWKLIADSDDKTTEVEVRDIKEIMLKIYEAHKKENVVLKMDCEGEEYQIMDRLDEEHLLDRIKIIMMEYHYGGEKKLTETLRKNHYSYWVFPHADQAGGGEIYAVRTGDNYY